MTKTLADLKKDKREFNIIKNKEPGEFDRHRLPTGIFPLDLSLGGGLPIFSTSSIYGDPKAGKTTATCKVIESAQKTCWNCLEYLWDCTCGQQLEKKVVFVSVEEFDFDWAEKLGVDTSKLIVAEPEYGELAVDLIYETIQAEDCCGVVLDSLGRVIPYSEITDSALNLKVGDKAKLHARLINKVKSCLLTAKRENNYKFFLAINQVRANISSAPFSPSETTPGGFASQHDWTLAIRQSQLSVDAKFKDKETELPLLGRYKSNFTSPASKRKLYTLRGTAEWWLSMGDSLYPVGMPIDWKPAMKHAEQVGILKGKPYYIGGDDKEFNTKKEMLSYWQENPDYFRSIKRKIVDYFVKADKGLIDVPQEAMPVEEDEEEENVE